MSWVHAHCAPQVGDVVRLQAHGDVTATSLTAKRHMSRIGHY